MSELWYEHVNDRRAPTGGEVGVDGHFYVGGEYMPFYVPRGVMPQVDEADYPELFAFLESEGVLIERVTLDPKEVKPHQHVELTYALDMPPEVRKKPVLISVEPYILDGNHRWYSNAHMGEELNAVKLAVDFERAIELLFKFPKTYSYGDGNFHPIQN